MQIKLDQIDLENKIVPDISKKKYNKKKDFEDAKC